MSRATLTRPCRLEVNARLDGSNEDLTDEQLFSAYRDLVKRVGGAEVFTVALRAEGEERLADSVLQYAACQTATDFLATER
jgi:hypothetical protein